MKIIQGIQRLFGKIVHRVKELILYDKKIQEYNNTLSIKQSTSLYIAFAIAIGFIVMSIANIYAKSWMMLALTGSSAILILVAIMLGFIFKREIIISHSMVVVCAVMFSIFGVVGGNEGFAILWIVLFPFVALLICNMRFAFVVNTFFLIYCFVILWTPVADIIPYKDYPSVFMLRFPLLYGVSYMLSYILAARLKTYQYHMLEKQKMLEYKKDYDEMTGVYNRSKFEELSAELFENCDSIGVMYFDVNFLKYTNDNFGHKAGDYIIKTTARSLKETLPKEDAYLFRMGGDEFTAIMVNCSKEKCESFLKDWKLKLEELNARPSKYLTSVAHGFEYYDNPGYELGRILERVDAQMYCVKRMMRKGVMKKYPEYFAHKDERQ